MPDEQSQSFLHQPESEPAAKDVLNDSSFGTRLRPNLYIEDLDLEDIRELDDKTDFEALEDLAESLDPCVVPLAVLEKGEATCGVISPKDRDDFIKFLEHEKDPEIMAIRGYPNGKIFGAYRYLTSGSPAAEDSDIASAVIGKSQLLTEAHRKKIGWVLDAWIAPAVRDQGLYPALTGHALHEIFEVKRMDVAVAYVRLHPCPNIALNAHQAVGWKLLKGEDKTIHIHYQQPTEAEFKAAENDPEQLDHLKRNDAIAKAGGLTLGIMIYTKADYERNIDILVAKKHEFVNSGDYRIFKC